MGIIGWIILGLLAGLIAKAILPGKTPAGSSSRRCSASSARSLAASSRKLSGSATRSTSSST